MLYIQISAYTRTCNNNLQQIAQMPNNANKQKYFVKQYTNYLHSCKNQKQNHETNEIK